MMTKTFSEGAANGLLPMSLSLSPKLLDEMFVTEYTYEALTVSKMHLLVK